MTILNTEEAADRILEKKGWDKDEIMKRARCVMLAQQLLGEADREALINQSLAFKEMDEVSIYETMERLGLDDEYVESEVSYFVLSELGDTELQNKDDELRQFEDKAYTCIRIVQRVLPSADESTIEEHALDLMHLEDQMLERLLEELQQ